jgi:ribosomal protein S18 acetylase RimI-like enzyme
VAGGAVEGYARDLVRAGGGSPDEVRERAAAQFVELLLHGLDTPGSWLMRVHDDEGTDVGVLWLGPNLQRPGVVHVFEIEIDRPHRGRGLGRAALLAAEDLVRAQGLTEISLNVFGFNDPARRLYDRLGYRVVSTAMTKTLEPGSD